MTERHYIKSENTRWPTRRVFLGAAAAVGVLAPAAPALAARAATRGARAVDASAAASSVAGIISAFTGPDGAGDAVDFPTSAYHSEWLTFESVVGFNPGSLINDSGSAMWVYNADPGSALITGPYCAFGSSQMTPYTFVSWLGDNLGTADQSYVAEYYQPAWFFIQYNVNTGIVQPPAPPA